MADTKIALITGANKGLGFETARQLGRAGVHVIVTSRDEQRGTKAAATLEGEGISVSYLSLEVTSSASISKAASLVEKKFGRLDILVNNAGIAPDLSTPASQVSLDQWRKTFETNVFGLVAVTQAMLPLLRKSAAGRIVNLSSVLGSLQLAADPASPVAGWAADGPAYCASKACVNMFTIRLAKELAGTSIKVNAAHPGWVKTDLGGSEAPMNVVDGARTSVQLALLPADGPSGGYFHLGERLPW